MYSGLEKKWPYVNGRRLSSCPQLEWRMKERFWRKWLPFDLRERCPSPSRFVDYSKFLVQLLATALVGILSVRETPCLTNPNSTFQTPRTNLLFCPPGPCLLPRYWLIDLCQETCPVLRPQCVSTVFSRHLDRDLVYANQLSVNNPAAERNGRHAWQLNTVPVSSAKDFVSA